MRKNKLVGLFMALIAGSLLLCGCPLDSKYPLDKPEEKIDSRLIGVWTNPEKHSETYKISRYNDKVYFVVMTDDAPPKNGMRKKQTEKYYAYVTLLNGTKFINISEKDPATANEFTFYKLEVRSKDELIVTNVNEKIGDDKEQSSGDLRAMFVKKMAMPNFYEKDPLHLVRKK